MAKIRKDLEPKLRATRKRLDAFVESRRERGRVISPLPAKGLLAYIARVPASEQVAPHRAGTIKWYAAELQKWTMQAKNLQSELDEALREKCELLRIAFDVLDELDSRRVFGKQGGQARSAAIKSRNDAWRELAHELQASRSPVSITHIAKIVKQRTRCAESERTIRGVISK